MNKKLLKSGLFGTGILAICCFTPVLVILLGMLGLSAALTWLDFVLLPLLGLCIGISVFALLPRRRGGEVSND